MSLDTLRQIALGQSKAHTEQIDHVTEDAPFLDLIPFTSATHDMWHNAEELTDVDSIGFVAMDAPLAEVSTSSKLIRFDLAKMGGKMIVAEDKARQMGGKENYFDKREPKILRATGQSTEQVLAYNNIRQYALDQYRSAGNKGNIYDAGGVGSTNFSIIAVRFEEEACSGLYNPSGFGDGVMFDTLPINGGNLYEINDEGVLGYGVRLKNDIGFMITGNRNAGAIVNIDLEAGIPADIDVMIDDMLGDIRATGNGRTMLLMHSRVRTRLMKKYKADRMDMRPEDKNINRKLRAWDDVPIITSYNMMKGTEAREVFS